MQNCQQDVSKLNPAMFKNNYILIPQPVGISPRYGSLNIWKLINVTHHLNRLCHITRCRKTFDKTQHPLMIIIEQMEYEIKNAI